MAGSPGARLSVLVATIALTLSSAARESSIADDQVLAAAERGEEVELDMPLTAFDSVLHPLEYTQNGEVISAALGVKFNKNSVVIEFVDANGDTAREYGIDIGWRLVKIGSEPIDQANIKQAIAKLTLKTPLQGGVRWSKVTWSKPE